MVSHSKKIFIQIGMANLSFLALSPLYLHTLNTHSTTDWFIRMRIIKKKKKINSFESQALKTRNPKMRSDLRHPPSLCPVPEDALQGKQWILAGLGSSKTFDTQRKISRRVNKAVVTFLKNEISRLLVTGSITGPWTTDTSALNSEEWAVGKGWITLKI